MLLFDIIRDWFCQYIWGGHLSTGEFFSAQIGLLGFDLGGGSGVDYDYASTGSTYVPIGKLFNDYDYTMISDYYLSIGDWLSTTSTIIVMILLCIVFGLMVRWLFRLTSGLLQGKC